MSKISINILIKKYTSGKISREEFLYFHALLNQHDTGNQSAEAIVNAASARRPTQQPQIAQTQQAPPPPAQTPAPSHPPQENPYSSPTIEIDTHYNPDAGYEGTQQSPAMHSRPSMMQAISGFFSQYYKQTAALVGIVGVMSTLMTTYFNSSPDDVQSKRTNIVRSMNLDGDSSKSSSTSRTQSSSGIESLAWRMIDRKLWGRGDITDFQSEWQNLNAKEQRKAKKSSWYRQFSLVLTTNLVQQSSLANDGNISAVYIERALSELTDTLKSGSRSEQKTRVASVQDDGEVNVTKTRVREQRREKPVPKRKKATPKTITQADIDKLIRRYVDHYENGNIRSIAKLFTDNRRKSNKRYSNSTLNEYKSVFKNTRARSLEIDDLEWDIDNDIAEGEGRYSSILKLSNNNRKEVIADIKFRLSVRGKSVLFDSIKLLNLEATSIPAKITTAKRSTKRKNNTNSDTARAKPFVEGNKKNRRLLVGSKEYRDIYSDRAKPKNVKRKPTKSELNDLVARYVDSYQYGDADEMITLFSGSTWTNDRSGVKQMRQDYQDLFDSTSSRRMTIDNLRWKFKKDKALGTGNLTLSSVSDLAEASEPDNGLSLQKGKIRLVVELRDDEALISHLYQIFN